MHCLNLVKFFFPFFFFSIRKKAQIDNKEYVKDTELKVSMVLIAMLLQKWDKL